MALGQEFITGLTFSLQNLLPCNISKIEGGDSWAALFIHKFSNSDISDSWLLLSWSSASSGICLASNYEFNALKNISASRSPIIDALKSRINKSEITDILQINNDKIIEFKFQRRISAGLNVNYSVILEATNPTANLLLLNHERKIDEAVRHSTPDQNSFRTILPGQPYVTPPPFNGVNINSVNSLNYEDVSNIKGIGRPLAKLIQNHWEELSPSSWLNKISSSINSSQEIPCKIISKNNYLTRFDYNFPETHSLNSNTIFAARFSVLLPLLDKARSKKLNEINSKLKRVIKSRERHKDGLLKQLNDCKIAETYRKKGEIILANIYKIKPYSSEIELSDWEGNSLKIALDPNLSPSKNAEKYFKKYRKSKGNVQEINQNLNNIIHIIKELNEQLDLLASLQNPDEFQKAANDLSEWLNPSDKNKTKFKSKKSPRNQANIPPHSVFEKDGFTILVGLSARGNRFVTFKQAHADDIWLHAHEVPGAHVIIKNIKRNQLENIHSNILKFAASLAASHSSAKSSNSVLVDYTERKYVRSVPGTTALVTYTNPGTIRVAPEPN